MTYVLTEDDVATGDVVTEQLEKMWAGTWPEASSP